MVPAVLVSLEVLLRVYRRVEGHPHSAAEVKRELLRMAEAIDQSVDQFDARPDAPSNPGAVRIPNPYYGWDPGTWTGLHASEAKYYASGAAGDALDVVVTGGSVAAGFFRDGRETLARLLSEDPRLAGRKIRIQGFAMGGLKQPQQLNLIGFQLALGHEPDVVLNIDGFNEVAVAGANWSSGMHPLYPKMAHWAYLVRTGKSRRELDLLLRLRSTQRDAAGLAELAIGLGAHHSAVLSTAAELSMVRLRARYTQQVHAYTRALASPELSGPLIEADFQGVMEICARGWAEASRSLAGMCDARGITYLHVLQPTLHDEGSKPLTPEEIETGTAATIWVRSARVGYPLLRAAGEDLDAAGIAFLDASMLFADVQETLYYDPCHFGPAGHERFAEVIAAALLEALPDDPWE